MKKFSIITEKFVNVFTRLDKEKYVDLVWDMLQAAYAGQGGLKGSGFTSKDDMIDNIDMWKIGKTAGKVVCVAMLKDKGGAKRVAVATDGTRAGKNKLLEIMVTDFRLGRCYAEISGASLKFLKKNAPDIVRKHVIPVDIARSKIAPKEIFTPHDNDPEVLMHPDLAEFFYSRKLGSGVLSTKIMIGNINAPGFIL